MCFKCLLILAFVKRFVCAVPGLNWKYTRRFRTYTTHRNPTTNCKIWEAARATTAAPKIFKAIEIAGTGSIKEHFIDASIKCNNPAKEVVDEARQVFGDDQHIGMLLSIGTGHPGIIGLSKPDAFQKLLPVKLLTALQDMATDCEGVASDLQKQYSNHPGIYLRFNVIHGAGQISLKEWKMIGEIMTHTTAYLQDELISKAVDMTVNCLCDPLQHKVLLGDLGML